MKFKKSAFFILLFNCFFLLAASGETSRNSGCADDHTDTVLVFRHANVLNPKGTKFLKDQDVAIRNGKILTISRRVKISGPSKSFDAKESYIVPGLIDAHVHVTAMKSNRIENTFNHLNYFLEHGITTVRDAGGDGAQLAIARKEIQSGAKSGANVFYSSFMAGDWYYNRGQGLRNEPFSPWEQMLKPGDNLDSAMVLAKGCGATGVKLYHSFDGAFLKEIADAARRNGLIVWGHAMMYPAKPVEVVEAGVKVLSHVYMIQNLSTDTLFNRRSTSESYKDSVIANMDIDRFCKLMTAKDAILDATLCVSVEREPWSLLLLKRIHEKGVKISAGTDQIVDLKRAYPRLIDELNYFVNNCGFTPAEALRSATLTAAEVIGQEHHIGSIEAGKSADMLVLDENPLKNINALKNIRQVVQSGRLIKHRE